MSEEELAELAEVEPAFVGRAVRAGALEAGGPGGLGPRDATRLRFLRAWDAAGLPVEAIGDLIAHGELPFTFMDVPIMAAPAAAAEHLRGLLRPTGHRAVDGAAAAAHLRRCPATADPGRGRPV